jgi:3-dehydroquinate synthase
MASPTAAQPADQAWSIVRVALGARSYDIVIGAEVLEAAGRLIKPLLGLPRVHIVTDRIVAAHHLKTLERALNDAGIEADSIVLDPGEQTKDFTHLASLTERLLAARLERRSTLLAFGGGVIGDLTGFAAAILLRGINFIQLPTTLLAQIDSSVGGKTGINAKHGKNLIGSFYQPKLVLADSGVLDSLPERQLRAGYAELVKYGLLGDAAFFAWLEANGAALLDGGREPRRHAVSVACQRKAEIVAKDEREDGVRALLNLGHTFGHAFEAETGFGPALLHGEAVALGMVLAFRLSVRLGLCGESELHRIERHFMAVGLPTRISAIVPRAWHADALIAHMRRDKKVRDGQIGFVLARGIGAAFLAHDVPLDAVRATLADFLAA